MQPWGWKPRYQPQVRVRINIVTANYRQATVLVPADASGSRRSHHAWVGRTRTVHDSSTWKMSAQLYMETVCAALHGNRLCNSTRKPSVQLYMESVCVLSGLFVQARTQGTNFEFVLLLFLSHTQECLKG